MCIIDLKDYPMGMSRFDSMTSDALASVGMGSRQTRDKLLGEEVAGSQETTRSVGEMQ